MILPDHEIIRLCRTERLVAPYDEANVQPASIDVALFDRFRVFLPASHGEPVDLANPIDATEAKQADSLLLQPGEFVLGATAELVLMPHDLVARIEGKSSVGRLGLAVHVTAGFIDPGFHGRITLEMVNLSPRPIVLRAGHLIAQLSFHRMVSSAARPYNGRYQGDMDVSASRSARARQGVV